MQILLWDLISQNAGVLIDYESHKFKRTILSTAPHDSTTGRSSSSYRCQQPCDHYCIDMQAEENVVCNFD